MRKIHKTGHRARNIRAWIGMALFFILLFGLMAVDRALQKHAQKIALPEGWQTIRPPHEAYCLALQGETVWAGGKEGVYAIDRASGSVKEELKNDPEFSYVRALLVDRSGRLWIGHERGLTAYDNGRLTTYTRKDGLPDDRVNAIIEDREGRLWVGTCFGAAVRQNDQWRTINKSGGLLDDMVNFILQDKDGGMWFGSYVAPYGGVSLLENGKWSYFSTAEGLPHNNITSIVQDKAGDVWVGAGLFDRGGLARIVKENSAWKIGAVFKKEDGLAGEKARSVFEDKRGSLWVGSEYDGLAIFQGGRWRQIKEKDGLCNPEIKSMLQDQSGDIWLGTRDGITRISAQTLP